MNKRILNTGVQSFITKNLNTDIMSVLLKKSTFKDISSKELVQQIEAKKKCQKKLPLWFNTPKIYYPKKLNIEQTSSALTAKYKSSLIKGKSIADLTGGFGVDSYFFSKKFEHVFHCEIDSNLSAISKHNFDILHAKNVTSICEDGMAFLKNFDSTFDWLYLDPSRRNSSKGKVFHLSDCTPDVTQHLELLFSKSKRILLKSAPLLDISSGITSLKHVKEIHIISIKNEVKEVLWLLEKNFSESIKIKTININSDSSQKFNFEWGDEKKAVVKIEKPQNYLYEPNSTILKSGAFKLVSQKYAVGKLHQHTHLYTSKEKIDFPGRIFKIESVSGYSKKELKKYKGTKANITAKNFPLSVAKIRNQFNINDGGDLYLFFTKLEDESLALIQGSKMQ